MPRKLSLVKLVKLSYPGLDGFSHNMFEWAMKVQFLPPRSRPTACLLTHRPSIGCKLVSHCILPQSSSRESSPCLWKLLKQENGWLSMAVIKTAVTLQCWRVTCILVVDYDLPSYWLTLARLSLWDFHFKIASKILALRRCNGDPEKKGFNT